MKRKHKFCPHCRDEEGKRMLTEVKEDGRCSECGGEYVEKPPADTGPFGIVKGGTPRFYR